MTRKLISISEIEHCPSEAPDSEECLSVLIEKVGQIKALKSVLCGECPSYVRMEGATFPGRCKRLGFWFPEDFSCGYCEANERRKRMRF